MQFTGIRNGRYLCLMYNNVYAFLSDRHLNSKISDISEYHLRNDNDFSIPRYRLTNTISSFFSRQHLNMWNDLNIVLQNIPTISRFERTLTTQKMSMLKYFNTRYILYTQLRYNFSSFNYDLFHCNLKNDPS